MKHGIAWVLLATDNYDQSLAFYRDTLGFTVEREVKDDEFCQFSLGNCFLAIFGRSHLEQVLDKKYLHQAGGAIYSFPDSDDIDTDYQLLKSKGVTFIKEPADTTLGSANGLFHRSRRAYLGATTVGEVIKIDSAQDSFSVYNE